MKTRNPIRDTVAFFVPAGRKRRKEKRKISMQAFFEDLENRGSLHPHYLFSVWTVQIREEMQKEGVWVLGNTKQNLAFVSEYVSRLQRKFWNSYPGEIKDLDIIMEARCAPLFRAFREWRVFRSIYTKIRIWGLRMKKFGLCKWDRDAVLLSYVRKYYSDYDLVLYGRWQMHSASRFEDEAVNRAYAIEPHGIVIPWRSRYQRLRRSS